jgi:microcystin-dependent protein
MPYTIKHTDEPNNGSITIEDRTVDTSTSLQFPGKNVTAYGSLIGENLLHLLENFAATSAPSSPVVGQLWYDTTPSANTLKIYDGTTWIASGGVKRSTNEPLAANSLVGDLWVNTTSQQLYLYSGSNWILVGPEFSQGLSTGFKITNIVGKDNINYTVMTIEIKAKPTVIISTNSFEPKAAITGFPQIEPGINLSQENISLQGVAEYVGPSKTSNNLIVGNDIVPSTSFVRNDTENTLSSQLKIRNNSGLKIGEAQNFNLTVDSGTASITNSTPTSSIDFRLNTGTAVSTVMRVNADSTVGINKTNPTETLDVNGKIKTNEGLLVTDNTNSSSASTGSIQTAGGIGVSQDLYVHGNVITNGQTSVTGNIIPSADDTVTLGSQSNKFSSVYASNFFGNFVGNISGTVTGVMNGPATKLASPTDFSLTGDISSQVISFNGQQAGGAVTFNTQIDPDFINNKNSATVINAADEVLLNQPSDVNEPLKKVTHAQFLSSIPKTPPGVFMPYGGDSDPDPTTVGGGIWLLCDGREVLISAYPLLYQIIGNKFKAAPAAAHFGLPDMRGRMPLGADNMGGTSANNVTSNAADTVGFTGGNETHNMLQSELPEHTHDLYNDSNNRQYYAARTTIEGATTGTVQIPTPSGLTDVQNSSAMLDVGGIKDYTAQTAVNLMNPFLVTHYIIYTGKDAT